MARKKQPKRNWLRTVIFLLAIPLIIWIGAFLVWFYWDDLNRRSDTERPVKQGSKGARSIKNEDAHQRPRPAKPQEKITEEDRRKLEDVLKQRN